MPAAHSPRESSSMMKTSSTDLAFGGVCGCSQGLETRLAVKKLIERRKVQSAKVNLSKSKCYRNNWLVEIKLKNISNTFSEHKALAGNIISWFVKEACSSVKNWKVNNMIIFQLKLPTKCSSWSSQASVSDSTQNSCWCCVPQNLPAAQETGKDKFMFIHTTIRRKNTMRCVCVHIHKKNHLTCLRCSNLVEANSKKHALCWKTGR